MPRVTNRIHRHLDPLIAEATRALELRREAVLPTDQALTEAATVRRSDVDRAVSFFRTAVAGTEIVGLLDGPGREDERE